MDFGKWRTAAAVFILLLLLFSPLLAGSASAESILPNNSASAGQNAESVTAAASGIGFAALFDFNNSNFNAQIKNIYYGMVDAGRIIVTILTITAGLMVALGIEDGKQLLWKWMLGIGLALNFGGVLLQLFQDSIPVAGRVDSVAIPQIMTNPTTDGPHDILSEFMRYYSDLTIKQAGPVLLAISVKLTIVLAAIDATYKLAMELISGDKVKFLVATAVKVGFFIFLETNWVPLATALSQFFESTGYTAAGMGNDFAPDSIWLNGMKMWTIMMGVSPDQAADSGVLSGVTNTVSSVFNGVGLLSTVGTNGLATTLTSIILIIFFMLLVFYISLEMLMARIEFYTMMILGLVMLPFGMIDKLSFLANQVISAMFNLAAKVMVIAFVGAVATNVLNKHMTSLKDSGVSLLGNFPVLLQLLLACLLFAFMVKKLPEMAQGFLQGNMSMSGQGMLQQTKQVIGTAVGVAATTAGAVTGAAAMTSGAAARAAAAGKPMSQMGQAMNLAGNLVRGIGSDIVGNSSVAQGFGKGARMVLGPYNNGNLNFGKRVGYMLSGGNGDLFQKLNTISKGQSENDTANGTGGNSGGDKSGQQAAPAQGIQGQGEKSEKREVINNIKESQNTEKLREQAAQPNGRAFNGMTPSQVAMRMQNAPQSQRNEAINSLMLAKGLTGDQKAEFAKAIDPNISTQKLDAIKASSISVKVQVPGEDVSGTATGNDSTPGESKPDTSNRKQSNHSK